VAALLALAGPDEAPYARLLEHLSIYMDAHWGDRAEPPPDGPKGAEPFGMRDVAARLSQPSTGVARAVELGCSVGRGLAELRRHANLVVGIDIHFGALRRARRMLSGAPLDYARRSSGRHYGRATATAGDRAAPDVALLCADALNPPLPPFAWNRVAALNLIDSLRAPTQLLSVMDKLCAPGGELLLASPYAWQSSIVAEEHRPTTADPAAEIARILREGQDLSARYTITDEAELAWWLRRDARSGTAYTIHWLRANKP
jgi:SAM-dependent methyltransferase